MPVAVVADSAAALPAELAAEHGITVVPLTIVIGDTEYRDGDLPLDEVLDRLDEGVSTSAPSPGEFAAGIEAALVGADSVLVVTIASALSATYEAAVTAAEDVEAPCRVVDAETAAGAEALVVLAAARTARAGGDLEDVEAAAKTVISKVRLIATLDSLDRLVESGRVPGIAGWAGRSLGVNPLFEFRQGGVKKMRPAFSRDAALDRIVAACFRDRPESEAHLHAAVLHAVDETTAEHLRDVVLWEEPDADVFVGPFSPVMVAHTGPRLAGLAWWWEERADAR